MDIHLKILRDLQAGPTTADSLAPRVKLTPQGTVAVLKTMEAEGKVESLPLAGMKEVRVYRRK